MTLAITDPLVLMILTSVQGNLDLGLRHITGGGEFDGGKMLVYD